MFTTIIRFNLIKGNQKIRRQTNSWSVKSQNG